LFGFSCRLLASGGLDMAFNQAYPLIIGRLHEVRQLGMYNLAQQFQQLPVNVVVSVFTRVNFPKMSAAQESTGQLLQIFRQALQFLTAVNVLLMSCLFVGAEDVVVLSVGPQWQDCTPYLRIMCLLGICIPVHTINLDLLKVKGRSDLFLRLEIVKKAMVLMALLITWPFGVMGLLWGQVGSSVLSLVVNTYYTGRLVDFGLMRQGRELWGTIGAGALATAVGCGLRYSLDGSRWLLLCLALSATVSVFIISLAFLNRSGYSISRDTLRIREFLKKARGRVQPGE
jgi:teichuronic acid exporter